MNTEWLDRFGGVASGACALHCLSLALAPALMTLFGMNHAMHGTLEWLFFGFASTFAIIAAVVGYRTHRVGWVVGGFALGLAVLTTGRLGEALSLFEGGVYFAVAGGGILVMSHVLSIQQTRRCQRACC